MTAPAPRELARWATSAHRRPRLLRGLAADARRVLAGLRWSGPDNAPTAPARPAPPHTTSGRRWGNLRRRLAPVPPWIDLDGPAPGRLPEGPVIMVANHPTTDSADLVAARLCPGRRARTVIVTTPRERYGLLSALVRRRVRVDFDAPGKAGVRLAQLLGEGWSALIFPEGLPAAGATKRPFHNFAADLAEQTGLPVVPVGIRGARAVRATPGVSRVSVRFGPPLHIGADARDQEAAVDGLIAEDGATWWAVQRSEPGQLPGTRTPQTAHTWRHVWAQTARPEKGGVTETPRIWR
ncbi:MAG: lysophospholipid acyltransferase family protein [Propionibacteriaceae bacterium]|nr:lysophospholipid acyltransferase family protein [Propionibacteriaceae bacterium]